MLANGALHFCQLPCAGIRWYWCEVWDSSVRPTPVTPQRQTAYTVSPALWACPRQAYGAAGVHSTGAVSSSWDKGQKVGASGGHRHTFAIYSDPYPRCGYKGGEAYSHTVL